MNVECAAARIRLPSAGGMPMPGRLGRHIASCDRCRAEQARYRVMARRLDDLAHRTHRAPGGIPGVVAVGMRRPVGSRPRPAPPGTHRTTVAAAAGAAVVAAVVIVGIRRARTA